MFGRRLDRAAWSALLLAGSAAPLAACGGDDSGDSVSVTTPGKCDQQLTYAAFGAQFVHAYCSSCHAGTLTGDARQGAPDNYVFDTLAQIALHSADMKSEVVEMKTMPFGETSLKPSDAQRVRFGQWLSCGAPP